MKVTFVNFKYVVTTSNSCQRVKTSRVSFAQNISYFIYNKGNNTATVRLLICPDGEIWLADGLEVKVLPKQLVTLVPNYFSKYCTLEYKSEGRSNPTNLSIWFQATRPPAKYCYGVGNDWL